jgi:hypothetical protein
MQTKLNSFFLTTYLFLSSSHLLHLLFKIIVSKINSKKNFKKKLKIFDKIFMTMHNLSI